VAGGLLVGGITFLMGAPWWWLPLCAAAGLLIGRVLPSDTSNILPSDTSKSGARRPVHALLRLCRSLPLWDRIAMSALLVVTATAVYIGMRNLHILSAFYLFLLPIVLAQLMFGARCDVAAAFVSLVSIYYFAIPPKNSFALQSLRELCLLAAFALLAFITSATLAVQADIAGIKDDHQPLQ
jgi:K+-sensing histidine kinase KdpD